jgi:hypothetical protein
MQAGLLTAEQRDEIMRVIRERCGDLFPMPAPYTMDELRDAAHAYADRATGALRTDEVFTELSELGRERRWLWHLMPELGRLFVVPEQIDPFEVIFRLEVR